MVFHIMAGIWKWGLRENFVPRGNKSKEEENKKSNEKLHRIAELQAHKF